MSSVYTVLEYRDSHRLSKQSWLLLYKGSDSSSLTASCPCHHVSLLAAISILASKETWHMRHLAVLDRQKTFNKCLLLWSLSLFLIYYFWLLRIRNKKKNHSKYAREVFTHECNESNEQKIIYWGFIICLLLLLLPSRFSRVWLCATP